MFPVDFVVILAQNLVFQKMIGLPGITAAGSRGKGLLRLGILTLFFCTVCAGLTAYLRPLIPAPAQKYVLPLSTAVMAAILDLLLVLVTKLTPGIREKLLPLLHNAAFSGTLLGAVLLSAEYTHDPAVAWRCGLQTGIGFLAACIMLKAAAPFCYSRKMPEAIRGRRGMFLYAALLSMAAACLFPAA